MVNNTQYFSVATVPSSVICDPYASHRKRFEAIIERLSELAPELRQVLLNIVLDYNPLLALSIGQSLKKLTQSISGLAVEFSGNVLNSGYSLSLTYHGELVVFIISKSSSQVAESIGKYRSMLDVPDRKVLIFKSMADYLVYKPQPSPSRGARTEFYPPWNES